MGKSRARKKRAKEEEDVNAAEVAMAKAVQRLQEIFSEQSEQVIRAMLLECNMNQDFAIDRLLSQQDVSNEQGASTQLTDSSTTTTSSVLVPNQSVVTHGETRSDSEAVLSSSVPSSSDVTNAETKSVPVSSTEAVSSLSVPSSSDVTNGETKSAPVSSTEVVSSFSVPSSSDVTNGETRSVTISSTEAVPSLSMPSSSDVANSETSSVPISSTEAVLPLPVPSTSDVANGETRSVTISSNVAAPPLSVPSSRPQLTKVKPKRQESRIITASGPSWVELLMGLHLPSKQNVTKAPLKADDSPLKPDATNPISNSVTESDATRDPQHSAFPMDTRQSIATASSSLGPRPQTSMATDDQVPSGGQYGNMMNFPISWRPPPIQPPGGSSSSSNSNTLAHHVDIMNSPYTWLEPDDASFYESLTSVFAPYRNCTLPLSAIDTVPSSHGFDMSSGNPANSSGGASIGPSSHGNGSNSRLGYGDYLPPVHLQGISPFVWRVEGEDSYRSTPPRSQQEREAYFERSRADVASSSTDQENNTSDQTQQRPRDK